MENGLYVALSQQTALSRSLSVVANNLANMTTTGFKADSTLFSTYLNGDHARTRIAQVEDHGLKTDFDPGPLTETGNPLDVAIIGDGWLTVEAASGPAYTRSGSLTQDETGRLVTQAGQPVLGETGQPLTLPRGATSIEIRGDGSIRVGGTRIGRLALVRFEDPQAMERIGDTLWTSKATPQPADQATLRQGMIEGSNVNAMLEMTRMIEIQRAYESSIQLSEREAERLRSMIRTFTQA